MKFQHDGEECKLIDGDFINEKHIVCAKLGIKISAPVDTTIDQARLLLNVYKKGFEYGKSFGESKKAREVRFALGIRGINHE